MKYAKRISPLKKLLNISYCNKLCHTCMFTKNIDINKSTMTLHFIYMYPLKYFVRQSLLNLHVLMFLYRMKDFFYAGNKLYFNNYSSILKVTETLNIPPQIMDQARDAFAPPTTIIQATRSPNKTRVNLKGKITKVNIF